MRFQFILLGLIMKTLLDFIEKNKEFFINLLNHFGPFLLGIPIVIAFSFVIMKGMPIDPFLSTVMNVCIIGYFFRK